MDGFEELCTRKKFHLNINNFFVSLAVKEDNRHYKHGMYQHCIYSLSCFVFRAQPVKTSTSKMEMIRSL